MKKSPFALSIVSAILALGAGALLIFLPNICSELAPYMSANFQHDLVNGFYDAFKATITFGVGSVIYSSVLVGLLGFVFIFWLWHFIMICVTKRADSLMTNLFWLIFGIVDVYVAFAYIGFANSSTGYVFNGTLNGKNITNGISLIANLTGAGLFENFKSIAILCVILLLALVSLILGFIAIVKAIHNDRVYPNVSLDEETEEEGKKEEGKPAEKTTNTIQDDKKNPVIVQNITYSGKGEPAPAQPVPPYPYPYAYAYPYGAMFPPPAAPKEEPKKEENKPLTEDDVRKLISEALAAQQAQFFAYTQSLQKPAEEPKEEVKEEEKKVEQPEVEDRPLTAKELRAIIKNELRDHDHPEELLPLTDEQCRALIRDELEEYYASTRPSKEPKEEVKEEPKSEPAKEDVEEDFMTADELSKMIRNEVVQIVGERPVEETITIDMVKDAINEALASYKPEIETLSKEDVSAIVKEELASTNETLTSTNEALNSTKDGLNSVKDELSSTKEGLASTKEGLDSLKDELSSIRNELASAKEDEAKQTESLYALKEQTFKNEYQAKFDSAKNAEAIESLEKSQLSADDIRKIIADELDKKLATMEPKVVEKVVEVEKAPEPEAVPETKEEPVVVEAAPEEAPAAPEAEKAARVPFANRVLALDDEVKEYYNELKEEAISYGLKSRLSISGDTFRLHTKTYFKMIVAGKGLKLYMALDPHDYKDSTIPVKDAGTKNLYKDIPLVFKVKSPLSLKRAKILIKDVCEKDGLVKQDIEHFNYVSQLDSYRISGGDEEEEIDEEE